MLPKTDNALILEPHPRHNHSTIGADPVDRFMTQGTAVESLEQRGQGAGNRAGSGLRQRYGRDGQENGNDST
jgi:hypothetical protein